MGLLWSSMVANMASYMLHVSELSHEPVSRISDVISVGQQLSLMCIGQDLRGNIKLSLKATLPKKSKKFDVVEGSADLSKQKPYSCNPGKDSPSQQENQNSAVKDLPADTDSSTKLNPSYSSMSPIVIRSALECDEEEKSAGLASSPLNNNSKPPRASKSSQKAKNLKSVKSNGLDLASSDSSLVSSRKARMGKPFLLTEKRASYGVSYTNSDEEDKDEEDKPTTAKILNCLQDQGSRVDGPIDAKKLKLGTKVTAKILQVRARGLVLDLGGGISGMYRFESGGKQEFEVGNEVQAQCTSFNSKGIPVMSILQDD